MVHDGWCMKGVPQVGQCVGSRGEQQTSCCSTTTRTLLQHDLAHARLAPAAGGVSGQTMRHSGN